jgi:hypothetical protein
MLPATETVNAEGVIVATVIFPVATIFPVTLTFPL